MCTCPEGYTCGLSWVGRGLGRLIMQKGRQSTGIVIPNKKALKTILWQREGLTVMYERLRLFGRVVKISGSNL